jgi:uncharacterized protein YbjT (DUF2867 family)
MEAGREPRVRGEVAAYFDAPTSPIGGHSSMYAITGITGQVGGIIGQALLRAKQPVRAIIRDRSKGRVWADRGCEVRMATIEDATSLTTAFRGAEGVFVLRRGTAPPGGSVQS